MVGLQVVPVVVFSKEPSEARHERHHGGAASTTGSLDWKPARIVGSSVRPQGRNKMTSSHGSLHGHRLERFGSRATKSISHRRRRHSTWIRLKADSIQSFRNWFGLEAGGRINRPTDQAPADQDQIEIRHQAFGIAPTACQGLSYSLLHTSIQFLETIKGGDVQIW